jgi:hypothetical protein
VQNRSWLNANQCPVEILKAILDAFNAHDLDAMQFFAEDLWEFKEGKIIRKDSYWKIVEKPV